MSVQRLGAEPLIRPADVRPYGAGNEVIGVFNAGVTQDAGQTILLLRVAERVPPRHSDEVIAWVYDAEAGRMVERAFGRNQTGVDLSDPRLIVTPETIYLTSLSTLRVARSGDGRCFTLDPEVLLRPETSYEAFGLEDPRITPIDGGWAIQYVAVSRRGVCVALAVTGDFRHVERRGIVFGPENKDVAFFPEPVGGRYYALHRPSSPFSLGNAIWLAESPDLLCWGKHRLLVDRRPGRWDGARIGAGAPPLRIDAGWLAIYHGADVESRYCLGAVLLDGEAPWRVLGRSEEPILAPEAPYERHGFFGEAVFTCGALLREDVVRVYYGAADTVIAAADIPLDTILAALV